MNLKNLLPAAVAGLIGLTTPACDRVQEKHKNDIKSIIELLEPESADIALSQELYERRPDLTNLSEEKIRSLAYGHAKLRSAAKLLQDGELSFEKFYNTVVISRERVITDKHTKLRSDFGEYYPSVSVGSKHIEFWTTDGNPNIILQDYTIAQVIMQGGELSITLQGNSYETTVTDQTQKQQIDVDLSPRDKSTPTTKTLTVRLLLAE